MFFVYSTTVNIQVNTLTTQYSARREPGQNEKRIQRETFSISVLQARKETSANLFDILFEPIRSLRLDEDEGFFPRLKGDIALAS